MGSNVSITTTAIYYLATTRVWNPPTTSWLPTTTANPTNVSFFISRAATAYNAYVNATTTATRITTTSGTDAHAVFFHAATTNDARS